MAKNNMKKRKLSTQPNTKSKKLVDHEENKPNTTNSGSDSDSDIENIEQLLKPFSKDQLITLLTNLACSNPTLSSRIRALADSDISHRKIFVYGLSFDTTNETLLSAFQPFGEIDDFNLVTDRVTGKAKGYAFITYKTRKGAEKALEDPQKKINNRIVSCQLAAVGPSNPVVGEKDVSGRKIYVSNVPVDVNVEKLRDFFAKFGEIESGPLGFDVETGRCKGYALFVYKSVEGARKALEEPCKLFEGRQLSCQKAAQGKNGGGAAGITSTVMSVSMPMSVPLQQQQHQPMMAAAALQNLALLGQNPNAAAAMGLLNMNPLYGGLIGNPGLGGLMNMNAFGLGQVGGGGAVPGGMGMMGYGPYGGVLGGPGFGSIGGLSTAPSVLGAYAVGSGGGAYGIGNARGVGSSAPVAQGLQQAYPSKLNGKTSSPAKAPTSGTRTSYS